MAIFSALAAAAIAAGSSAWVIAGWQLLGVATQMILSKMLAPDPPDQSGGGNKQQLPPATTNMIPIIYGSAFSKPVIVDAKISIDQKSMWYVMAFSQVPDSGTINFDDPNNPGYPLIYWGDRRMTFAADKVTLTSLVDDNNDGQVDTKLANKIRVWCFSNGSNYGLYGSPSAINVLSQANIDPESEPWTANHLMSKTAFIVVRIDWDQENGLTGLQNVTALVNNSLKSPGIVIKDYLTNDRYGCNIPLGNIDESSLTALDTYSNELITYKEYAYNSTTNYVTKTTKRYEINGAVNTNNKFLVNLQALTKSCDSWLQWDETRGKWKVVINQSYSQAGKTINDLYAIYADTTFASIGTNIPAANSGYVIGGVSISPSDLNSNYNSVEVQHPDGSKKDITKYQYVNLPDNLRAPNEPDNKFTLTLPFTNNSGSAVYIATRKLAQAREDLNVTLLVDHSGIQVEAGDVVRVYHKHYGWTHTEGLPNGKLFRVMEVRENKDEEGNLTASLVLIEYNDSIYGNLDINTFLPNPNTGLSDPSFISTPGAPTVQNIGINNVIPHFSVTAIVPSQGIVTAMEFWYTASTSAPGANAVYTKYTTQTNNLSAAYSAGQSITFTVGDLPALSGANRYYWRVRAIGTYTKSAFSPASSSFEWSPINEVQNFQVLAPSYTITAPWDGTNHILTGTSASVYATNGLVTVQFTTATTDAAMANNTWRFDYTTKTQSNLTVGDATVSGTNALLPALSTLTQNSGYVEISTRYKSNTGVVYPTPAVRITYNKQIAGINGSTGAPGPVGDKTTIVYLYQWSTVTPGNPSGTSTFTWASASNGSYTGVNNWQTAIPPNPGVSGIRLFRASKSITVPGSEATSTVSWDSGFSVVDVTQNGANGLQNAKPAVYQWASSIPAGPSGSSTYTWSGGTFTAPSGWTLTPAASPSTGFTLYKAEVNVSDSAGVGSTAFNWTNATISAVGYSAINGANGATGPQGPAGATGNQGASARLAYARIANNPQPFAGTHTVGGDSLPSFPTTWGAAFQVQWYSSDPTPSSNNTLYQSDGIYNPATNQTVWSTPYISSLKVGSLSAITANMGTLTSGEIIVGSSPAITGDATTTNMTGSGFRLYPDGGFVLGSASPSGSNISYSPTYGKMFLNGQIVQTNNLVNNAVTDANSGTIVTSNLQSILTFGIPIPVNCLMLYIWVDGGEYLLELSTGSGEASSTEVLIANTQYRLFTGGEPVVPLSSDPIARAIGGHHWAVPNIATGTFNLNFHMFRPDLSNSPSVRNTPGRVSWLILKK